MLGPLTGDHFYVYVADKCVRPSYECHDRVLNIMVRARVDLPACVRAGGEKSLLAIHVCVLAPARATVTT